MMISRILLLSLTLLPLVACKSNKQPGELSDKEKVELYFERAARYYEMRDLDRCQDQVQRGLEIDPDNERLMLMLGRCYQTRGKLQDITIAEQIFRDHPAKDDYRVHLCLGGTLERKGSYYSDAAEGVASGELFTEAADPEARAKELSGKAHEFWTEAIEGYEKALELYPGTFEALNGLMRTTAFMREYPASMDWSTQFLDSIRESNEVFSKRLKELVARGERTVDTERTLLNNSDLEVQVRVHRAELLHMDGKVRESLKELDTALTLNDTNADIYAQRGQLLHKLDEYQRSNDSLQRYLSLSEDEFDHPNIREAFAMIEKNKAAMGSK